MIIALDESGTHGEDFLIIGALIIPKPGPLVRRLCEIKEDHKYFNTESRRRTKYKEMHFVDISTERDQAVAVEWIDAFTQHQCWFRSIVIDWSIWNPKYFGDPFEEEALKKRRAYKKWAEMLIHPEVTGQLGAWLKLDELRICYGYDVIAALKERFGNPYKGRPPRIFRFQKVRSWKDGNQDVQLCDLLTGCVYNSLVPPTGKKSQKKIEVRNYFFETLRNFGVKDCSPGYWKGFAKTTLRDRFPKFSEWFWRPES